jgi:DNA polymerase-3 subunit alpha
VTNFIDLHCHSTFSSAMTHGDAVGSPTEIVKRAVELGWNAVAITEHGWLGSAPAIYKLAKQNKIKPILGCELYVVPDYVLGQLSKEFQPMSYHLTVLALSMEGYQNLVAWTSEAMLRHNYYHKPRISLMRMAEIAPWPLHHNVVMSGCLGSELSFTLQSGNGTGLAMGMAYVEQMKMLFPNFYIEIWNHEIPKFMSPEFQAYYDMIKREAAVRKRLIALAKITDTPLVLTNDSHMQRASDRRAHIAMKATSWQHRDDAHMGKSEGQVITKFLPDYAYFANYMRDMEKVADGLPQQVRNSVEEIVMEAEIRLEPLDHFSYSIPNSGYTDPVRALRKVSKDRLGKLVAKHGDLARDRFELELEAMGSFAHYLLLMSDFIREAHAQGILTWTRGSAANSLLCYCLGIHEIDSIAYSLVFSRFYNPARKKLPDIDVDIDPERHDDFIRIVQQHMEPLVGEGQIVPMGNWLTAANRTAFRQAATALGIPKETQDEISKLLPQMIDSGVVDEETDVFIALKEEYPEIYDLTSQIFDSVKGVGQHACAWLFGTPERPVRDWVPMYLIASSGKLVTQFDFKALEDFGLTKMDFLRLKTLTIAAKTLKAIGKSPLEFYDIPVNDPKTLKMFRAGNTDGVHTVQGKEVRRGCVEIQVESVHDVILAAALYRPANTRIGQDKMYVERRRGLEKVSYPHKIVEEIVGPTFGIPVFQEQAMEIGYAVGMDDEGVDEIYQAIKKAKGAGRGAKEAFAAVKPKFMAAAKSVMKKTARLETWEFVKGFQGYGFNKGHASSYGILAMKMGYLKCHHTGEFYASLLDTYPERPTYVAAARAENYEFAPPCVNRSGFGFTLDKQAGNAIRIGLKKVEGLGPVAVNEILHGQPYTDFEDLKARTRRTAVNAPRIERLASLGAFEMLGIDGITDRMDRDIHQFHSLGMVLKKPAAFKGVKPTHTGERTSESGWRHAGRERGLALTDGRSSVSKLFWVPPEPPKTEKEKAQNKQKFISLEASPWAQVKTWLLTVVDENGLPFHLMVNEDKEYEVALLKFLHLRCQGAVLCADGMIRLPFKSNGPQGFRFFGITGSYRGDPQVFRLSKLKDQKYKKAIAELDRMKRANRYGNG